MFGFLFKKNFYDIWDNFFHLLVINLIYTVLIFGGVFGFLGLCSIEMQTGIRFIVLGAAILAFSMIFHIFLFAQGKSAEKISNYSVPKLRDFFGNIIPSIKDGVLFGLFFGMLVLVAIVSIPSYLNLGVADGDPAKSLVGLVLAFFVFWILIIVLLALQWFMAVRNVLHNSFGKCLRKSFILLFDNFWFTLGMALINLVNLAITTLTMSLMPGFTGIQVCATNALHLRMYKYDWYEVNPGMTKDQRRHVPWDQLLQKDRKLMGARKLRNIFVPWKE
ncbi:MAG: hypothetical protein IKI90_07025 [Treponema sp.]|nr:hypothetical protein [Treponema sp.]